MVNNITMPAPKIDSSVQVASNNETSFGAIHVALKAIQQVGKVFSFILSPFVMGYSVLSRVVTHLFGFKNKHTETFEEAIRGALEEQKQRKIEEIAQRGVEAWNTSSKTSNQYKTDRNRLCLNIQLLDDTTRANLEYRTFSTLESDPEWIAKAEQTFDDIGAKQGIPSDALKEMVTQTMGADVMEFLQGVIVREAVIHRMPALSRVPYSLMEFKFQFTDKGLTLNIESVWQLRDPDEAQQVCYFTTVSTYEFIKTTQMDGNPGWPEAKSLSFHALKTDQLDPRFLLSSLQTLENQKQTNA